MHRLRGRAVRTVLFFLLTGGGLLLASCFPLRPNTSPVARFSADPPAGYIPLAVEFDAKDSYDPDGRILSYEWAFGDGKTGRGRALTHSYTEPGTYDVSLRVVDDRSGEDASALEVLTLAVPVGQLVRRWRWEHGGGEEYLEVLLPENLYRQYAGRERLPLVDNYEYALYVLDPLDDPTLEDLARLLAGRAGEGDLAFAECALSFVQGAIRYAADPAGIEYPLYPLETLVDGRGDCEDTTILYVSLLRALGHPASMAFVDTDEDDLPDHVLALVPVPSTYPGSVTCPEGTKKGFLTIAGGLYAVAETVVGPASGYIPLGCDPWGLVPEDIKDRWDF